MSLFSVPALFIVFRESFEASIICSVLFGVLRKTGLTHLNRYVRLGVVLGLIFTGLVLAGTLIAFKIATERLTREHGSNASDDGDDDSANLAEIRLNVGLTFCAALLIMFICWTLGDILKKHDEIERRLMREAEDAVKEDKAVTWSTIFFLTFTAVAREGVEVVVFLGVGSGFEAKSLPIPIVVGMLCGALAGYILYFAGSKVTLKWFFRIAVVFLAFVGAGVFTHAVEDLHHLVSFGWWGVYVFNISYCCGLRYPQYQLFRAVFGYTPAPSRAEMMAYFMYWLALLLGFLVKWYLQRKGLHPMQAVKDKVKKGFVQIRGKFKGESEEEIANEEPTVDDKRSKEQVEMDLVKEINAVKNSDKDSNSV